MGELSDYLHYKLNLILYMYIHTTCLLTIISSKYCLCMEESTWCCILFKALYSTTHSKVMILGGNISNAWSRQYKSKDISRYTYGFSQYVNMPAMLLYFHLLIRKIHWSLLISRTTAGEGGPMILFYKWSNTVQYMKYKTM